MVDQLQRPVDKVEVYFFTEQPNGYVKEEDLDKYPGTRMMFPNTYFDPEKAHVLYNQYHEQYASWTRWDSTASCPTSTTPPTGA